jgi:hypothetical protein
MERLGANQKDRIHLILFDGQGVQPVIVEGPFDYHSSIPRPAEASVVVQPPSFDLSVSTYF